MSNGLVIRADADIRMGTGHVMRCIAFGQAWQDAGGAVSFVCYCDSDRIKARIREEGFSLVELTVAYPDSTEDLSTTLNVAKQIGAAWVMVDGYHFDLEYQQSIRQAGLKLLTVDDYNHHQQYEADILLNQNIGADELDYRINLDCQLLTGLKGVMLRREFRHSISLKNDGGPIRNLLILSGGSDPDNVSLKLIERMDELGMPNLNVRIVVGPANAHVPSLQAAIQKLDCQVELLINISDMPAVMSWADFAISAAGSTCWELASLGIPFATYILAENQQAISEKLDCMTGIRSLGWVDKNFRERFLSFFDTVLKDASTLSDYRKGMSGIVDQFGVDRILSRMAGKEMNIYKDRLSIRSVNNDDTEILLKWANDPVTRTNSFNSEPIEYAAHCSWLEVKLLSNDTIMLVMELNGVPCGHIRYDHQENGDVLLSYVLAPDFRGMKLGGRLVELGQDIVLKQFNPQRIKAMTFVENQPSTRIFEKAGFSRSSVEIQGRECNEFIWSKNDEC